MNATTKRFLILLACTALVGWISVNWLLGPPGLSSAYLASHSVDHERYLEAIKNDAYKHYVQRPHLVNLDENPELKQRVALVAAYTDGKAFQAEQHRIHLYSLFFEIFNATIVVVLVLRLAKAPLLQYLDVQIEELRDKINKAARSRKSALGRRGIAEEKIAHIDDEEMKLNANTETRMERELADLAEASHYSFGLHERELSERKKAEAHKAELALKHRLVYDAIDLLIKQVQEEESAEGHDALIHQFTHDLEARS